VSGGGNSYTAEYWQYDPRLGRRWNVDPLVYDWQSPYATFNNNPIYFSDPRGLEGEKPKPNERGHKYDCGDGTCEYFDGENYVSKVEYFHKAFFNPESFGYFGDLSYKEQISEAITGYGAILRANYLKNKQSRTPEQVTARNNKIAITADDLQNKLPKNQSFVPFNSAILCVY